MPSKQEPEFIKVNKWDGISVKNSLDDAVKEILTKKFNYVEDHIHNRNFQISNLI